MSEPKHKARVYKGKAITVSYDVKLCMHAAECVSSGLKKVFDKATRPWVNPDGSSPERIIDVIERCPSGALTYEYTLSEESEVNRVTPQADGALYFRGDLKLELADESINAKRLALCRCGHSKNKPYCDYSHYEAAFSDEGIPATQLSPEIIDTEAGLSISPAKDGPLLLDGAFSLRSMDNLHISYGTKTALCRCGHSKNKPFCDGSHVETGFEA